MVKDSQNRNKFYSEVDRAHLKKSYDQLQFLIRSHKYFDNKDELQSLVEQLYQAIQNDHNNDERKKFITNFENSVKPIINQLPNKNYSWLGYLVIAIILASVCYFVFICLIDLAAASWLIALSFVLLLASISAILILFAVILAAGINGSTDDNRLQIELNNFLDVVKNYEPIQVKNGNIEADSHEEDNNNSQEESKNSAEDTPSTSSSNQNENVIAKNLECRGKRIKSNSLPISQSNTFPNVMSTSSLPDRPTTDGTKKPPISLRIKSSSTPTITTFSENEVNKQSSDATRNLLSSVASVRLRIPSIPVTQSTSAPIIVEENFVNKSANPENFSNMTKMYTNDPGEYYVPGQINNTPSKKRNSNNQRKNKVFLEKKTEKVVNKEEKDDREIKKINSLSKSHDSISSSKSERSVSQVRQSASVPMVSTNTNFSAKLLKLLDSNQRASHSQQLPTNLSVLDSMHQIQRSKRILSASQSLGEKNTEKQQEDKVPLTSNSV